MATVLSTSKDGIMCWSCRRFFPTDRATTSAGQCFVNVSDPEALAQVAADIAQAEAFVCDQYIRTLEEVPEVP